MTFSLYAIVRLLEILQARLVFGAACTPSRQKARSRAWGMGPLAAPSRLVGCPVHGGEVDSLFVHLVQGRHLPQLVDLADHEVGDVVDLLQRVEAAEAEADRRVGEVVADAHRVEHVRGLEAGAGAGRAAR